MKKLIMLLATVLAAALPLKAATETVGGYTWTYRINGDGAEIFTSPYSAAIYPKPTGAVTIPSTLGGKPVTSIGEYAFYECSGLTSVTIPDSVTNILEGAFSFCSGLASVSIPDGVTNIEERAFSLCTNLTSVTIPNSVTCIGEGAFAWCSGLTSVTIPDSVTIIRYNAFVNCRGLTSVTIGNSVTSIGSYAFSGCFGLTNVTIGNSVTRIEEAAFSFCSGLTSMTIPDSVTRIGEWAFYGCSGLTSVTIPASVTSIRKKAFAYCYGLTSVKLPRRFEGNLDESVFECCSENLVITYYDPPPYVICFHRNDANDGKVEEYEFDYGVDTRLPSLNKLGWARRGFDFLGWATSEANAAKGVVWKKDWAVVSTAAQAGKTIDVWAVWALKSDSYAIKFVRNDGAGTWRTVGFKHGEKTRMPSLQNGLGWARRGYTFKGWARTTADAAAGKVWKADWSYVIKAAENGKTLTLYAVWELMPGYYQIRFNKNDGTTKWRSLGFAVDASTKLSTIKGLGWERAGYTFKGWATSKANADAGKVWKADGATVKNAAAEGKTLSIYAIWE